MTEAGRTRVLVQCIGNRLRGDDAAGLAVADRLRGLGLPDSVQILEHWGEGTALMLHWSAARYVILVDAARSGARPGTVHFFDGRHEELPRNFFYGSTHRFGVAEAVELARRLNRLPQRLHLYAIEGESFELGSGASVAMIKAAAEVADTILVSLLAEEER